MTEVRFANLLSRQLISLSSETIIQDGQRLWLGVIGYWNPKVAKGSFIRTYRVFSSIPVQHL